MLFNATHFTITLTIIVVFYCNTFCAARDSGPWNRAKEKNKTGRTLLALLEKIGDTGEKVTGAVLDVTKPNDVCYGDWGCFPAITNCFPLIFGLWGRPYSPNAMQPTFHVFRDVKDPLGKTIDLRLQKVDFIKAGFIANATTMKYIFVIHGYASRYEPNGWMADIKNLILRKSPKKYFVIIVDWSIGADRINYQIARANTKVIGVVVAHPAGPCFIDPEESLSKTDAEIVVAIHTDTNLFGNQRYLAHYDIFPDGGKFQSNCSHVSVLKLTNPMDYLYQIVMHIGKQRTETSITETLLFTFVGQRRGSIEVQLVEAVDGDQFTALLAIAERDVNGGSPGLINSATLVRKGGYGKYILNISKIEVNYMTNIDQRVENKFSVEKLLFILQASSDEKLCTKYLKTRK
ncbi:lipase-like protein 1, partial [Leptotrombidium deliense]